MHGTKLFDVTVLCYYLTLKPFDFITLCLCHHGATFGNLSLNSQVHVRLVEAEWSSS